MREQRNRLSGSADPHAVRGRSDRTSRPISLTLINCIRRYISETWRLPYQLPANRAHNLSPSHVFDARQKTAGGRGKHLQTGNTSPYSRYAGTSPSATFLPVSGALLCSVSCCVWTEFSVSCTHEESDHSFLSPSCSFALLLSRSASSPADQCRRVVCLHFAFALALLLKRLVGRTWAPVAPSFPCTCLLLACLRRYIPSLPLSFARLCARGSPFCPARGNPRPCLVGCATAAASEKRPERLVVTVCAKQLFPSSSPAHGIVCVDLSLERQERCQASERKRQTSRRKRAPGPGEANLDCKRMTKEGAFLLRVHNDAAFVCV